MVIGINGCLFVGPSELNDRATQLRYTGFIRNLFTFPLMTFGNMIGILI